MLVMCWVTITVAANEPKFENSPFVGLEIPKRTLTNHNMLGSRLHQRSDTSLIALSVFQLQYTLSIRRFSSQFVLIPVTSMLEPLPAAFE